MILAEAANHLPAPEHFASVGWVIVILVAIVAGLNQAVGFYKEHIRANPEPSATYATKADLEKGLDSLSEEIARDREVNRKEHEGIFTKIGGHERGINQTLMNLGYKVSALDERTETTNSTLVQLGQKVDRIIERIKA